MKGSSYSFTPRGGGVTYRDATIDGQPVTIRELTDLNLYDVGPCTTLAYRAAASWIATPAPTPTRSYTTLASIADLNSPAARCRRNMKAAMVRMGIPTTTRHR